MARFLAGLGAGAIAGAVTYLFSHATPYPALGVGLFVACLVWFGEYIDELLPW